MKKVDLTLSTLKPIHARWPFIVFEKLRSDMKVKLIGWERTGISEVAESALTLNLE